MVKAIALLSGGLDSVLATKLIINQGITVEAVNFLTVFCTRENSFCFTTKSASEKLGIRLKIFEVGEEYLEIVRKPKYGYGSQINPCIDCRIFMFKKAKEYMKEVGASFLITGEVLGERPMSQKKEVLRIVEKEAGLEGLVLRPLSAKLLEPTIPEKRGWIDRDKLLAIQGRSRKPQIELAKQLGIEDYLNPSGGCLLTDPAFAKRMRDLMKHNPFFSLRDVKFLKLGRHFRLSPYAKLIVGRDQQENEKLLNLAEENDLCFFPQDLKGPVAIGRGDFPQDLVLLGAKIVSRYCDNNSVKISYRKISNCLLEMVSVYPLSEEEINKLRI